MRIVLSAADRARIEDAARAAFPAECCGLIEGVVEGDTVHVVRLHEARNCAAAPDRFEIAPEDHFAALRSARAAGHDLVGCYHSHPRGQAWPSAHDAAGAGEDGFIWLIAPIPAGQGDVALKAFRYRADGFSQISLATGADLVTSSLKQRK